MFLQRLLRLALLGAFIDVGLCETITGYIYCDNQFEFYFNGVLIASDPLMFTPHQAVRVSFEYDGVSSKTYAIMCQDWASDSGYEYTETNNPQLGDGALIAKFSDGTVTSRAWKSYTVTFGPTDASYDAGCSATSRDSCVVEDNGEPLKWTVPGFDDSTWSYSTTYTAAAAGWGRTPNWQGGQCCTVTSPYSRDDVGCNVDAVTGEAVTVTEDECLDPESTSVLNGVGAEFIWGGDLERDNKMLFRYKIDAPTDSPTKAPTRNPTTPDQAQHRVTRPPTEAPTANNGPPPTQSPTGTASPTVATPTRPTRSPTTLGGTDSPTGSAPTRPTRAPTNTQGPTAAPTVPTKPAPTTKTPTSAPTTTRSPTTSAPTSAPTGAPAVTSDVSDSSATSLGVSLAKICLSVTVLAIFYW